jgi:hypothetical protein
MNSRPAPAPRPARSRGPRGRAAAGTEGPVRISVFNGAWNFLGLGIIIVDMETITLNPQIVGQAENAHGAIMDLVLAGTGLDRDRWVALSLITFAGGTIETDTLIARAADALKIAPDTARAAIKALDATGLVTQDGAQVTITEAGRTLVAAVRGKTGPIIARAYADVPAEDLALAARVLIQITKGLNRELATIS